MPSSYLETAFPFRPAFRFAPKTKTSETLGITSWTAVAARPSRTRALVRTNAYIWPLQGLSRGVACMPRSATTHQYRTLSAPSDKTLRLMTTHQQPSCEGTACRTCIWVLSRAHADLAGPWLARIPPRTEAHPFLLTPSARISRFAHGRSSDWVAAAKS